MEVMILYGSNHSVFGKMMFIANTAAVHTDQLDVLIGGLSLIFLIISTLIGVLIRFVSKATTIQDNVQNLTNKVVETNQKMDERVTWLERNVWGTLGKRNGR
jgi:type III secretory pathway component EscS